MATLARRSVFLLTTVGATAMLLGTPVTAQSSPPGGSPPPGTPPSPNPPMPPTSTSEPAAAAQPASALGTNPSLGAILITARRRSEALEKVPVAVTALTSDVLRQKGISEVNDLQYNTPNLTAQAALEGRQSARFFIRGQGATFGGSLPSVVTYLAEVPLDAAGGGAFALMDLDSVQVLRGPQGTLFGRNANGGAVILTPRAPDPNFGGFAEASYGNYNALRLTGAMSIPVTDTLGVRLSGQFERHSGYTKNLGGPNLDDDHQGSWRAFVRWKPTSNIRDDFIYAGVNGHDHGTASILDQLRSPSAAASYPLPFPLPNQLGPGFAVDLANQQIWGPHKVDYIAGLIGNRRNINFFANTLSWDIGGGATLKNITSYQRIKVCSSDVPVTSATNFYLSSCLPNQYSTSISPNIYPSVNLRNWSTETNIGGETLNNKLTYIAGFFLLDSNTPGGLNAFRVSKVSKTSIAANVSTSQTHDKTQAIYGQGTYSLTDVLKATAGLRYTWDQRATSFGQYQSLANGAAGTFHCIAPGKPANAAPDNCFNIYRKDSSGLNYTFSLDWQATHQLLLYAVTRRGYKAGGINNLSTSATPAYDPEILTDAEVGAKWAWSTELGSGTLNAAYFHGWYKNIQAQLVRIEPGGGAAVLIGNAGKANLDGVEIEGSFRSGGFNLSAFYSYLNGKYKPGTFIDVGIDVSASKFNGLSKNTFSATASYSVPLNHPGENLSISGTYYTRSKAAYSADNVLDPQAFAPGYQIVNGRLEWANIGGSKITAAAFVDNLFNKNYAVGGFALVGLIGTDAKVYGAPRTYGGSLSVRF